MQTELEDKIAGNVVITHRIAGLVFRTESNARLLRLREEPYDKFRVENTEPDVRHRLHKLDLGTSTSWVSEIDRLDSSLLRSPLVRARLESCLDRLDQIEVRSDRDQVVVRNFSRCELDFFYVRDLEGFHPDRDVDYSEYRLAAKFRTVFATFFPAFSSVMVHSSGVIRNGKAALFLAPPNGGKSTVVKQASGDPILSDDQIVWHREGDRIVTHGTPIGSLTSGPCQAELGGLFLLEKADHFELKPLDRAEMVQFLWSENPNHSFFLPQRLKRAAFNILVDGCHQAPTYRMRFPRDYIDWDAIDAAMAG